MRLPQLPAVTLLPLLLVACGAQRESESAEDFAARLDGAASPAPQQRNPQLAGLPQAADDGRQALDLRSAYVQKTPDGAENGLQIRQDGTFTLVENGQTITGTYEWLPDGKRLRLNGVELRPIVLVADGALYRMANDRVPIDDVTPDRMYTLGGGE